MRAVCWQGSNHVEVEKVPDPRILNPRDIVVKITSTAICGSDLHLYDGVIPTMQKGDILGHEFMGEVVELGPSVKNLKIGDKVVVPFNISCGHCFFCERKDYSLCDNSNPKPEVAEKVYGHGGAGLFGYSHMYGGYAGGQAEYARVPYGDVGPLVVPKDMDDDKLLFLSDIFPTGYMAAVNCNIQRGDTVAVWGCGPVGLFAIQSAYLLGAERVIAIDHVPERLRMAREVCNAETLNYEEVDVLESLNIMTGGRGPDSCIDAVGMEAHGTDLYSKYEHMKMVAKMTTDRPVALRQAIQACRKGGTVSIPGVYGGLLDKVPMGAAFGKALTMKMGQTHVKKYMPELLDLILQGRVDPSFLITHRISIDQAPDAYKMFKDKQDSCVKVVIKN
ncbi:glutathione-dependent formaldehyde dehydrogenase [Bdellovibrio bacteriovorus]|uniref:Glutathione-dependent formaldehyde dehydrogenase n=1 Tax=Bdellovibrio bacteriovorus TaxID=959 RepID=A0A150WFG2_BDEBC|nr:zinc-dependent alcohol dehydrogenase [Bdellovibrio bacteriovorus]KYG61867.1 glutathione-dependent formaldehyde dehydrogenase [Bdellovibrio bacteriovorus]